MHIWWNIYEGESVVSEYAPWSSSQLTSWNLRRKTLKKKTWRSSSACRRIVIAVSLSQFLGKWFFTPLRFLLRVGYRGIFLLELLGRRLQLEAEVAVAYAQLWCVSFETLDVSTSLCAWLSCKAPRGHQQFMRNLTEDIKPLLEEGYSEQDMCACLVLMNPLAWFASLTVSSWKSAHFCFWSPSRGGSPGIATTVWNNELSKNNLWEAWNHLRDIPESGNSFQDTGLWTAPFVSQRNRWMSAFQANVSAFSNEKSVGIKFGQKLGVQNGSGLWSRMMFHQMTLHWP